MHAMLCLQVKATLDQLNDNVRYYSDKLLCNRIIPLYYFIPYKAYFYPFHAFMYSFSFSWL